MEFKNFIPESWTQFKTLFKKFFKKTFVGTRAEWNLLSVAEKKEYDIANITDDLAGGELIVTDAVTDGDLNPVTSNAVYNAIKSGTPLYFKSDNSGVLNIPSTVADTDLRGLWTFELAIPASDANETGIAIGFLWVVDSSSNTRLNVLVEGHKSVTYTLSVSAHRQITLTSSSGSPIFTMKKLMDWL